MPIWCKSSLLQLEDHIKVACPDIWQNCVPGLEISWPLPTRYFFVILNCSTASITGQRYVHTLQLLAILDKLFWWSAPFTTLFHQIHSMDDNGERESVADAKGHSPCFCHLYCQSTTEFLNPLLHFNECVHFRTDLFDSNCQSDLSTLIAMKFDE